MTVATFAQTDFNTQTPSQYRAAIDADIAVAAPIVDNFAPHSVATPNMTVQLDAGAIPGVGVLPTQIALQTSGTLTAPVTNPRKDIVYIDAITGVIGVATGTEATSPVDPAIPSGKIPIARLAMTVGMTTISNSIITDLRAPAMATSGSGSVVAISSNTTITVGQSGTTFKLSGTSVTATLPTPIGNSGIKYRLFGSDTNTQTVSTPAATLNFPDGTTVAGVGLTNNQSLDIQSDGAVWRVLGMAGWQVAQTPATADNSTKVSTTAMVQAAIAAAIAALPSTYSTGDVKPTFKTAADTGWVMMDDGTIGDASSGASTRANADTSALFTLLWNNISNTYCAVSGGVRGASAAADFAAHKTIALPKALGRALAIAGAGSGLTSRALGLINGEESHALTITEMPAHDHALQGWTGSGLGTDAEYAFNNTALASMGPPYSGTRGGGAAHNNMQPSFFLNIMVKL